MKTQEDYLTTEKWWKTRQEDNSTMGTWLKRKTGIGKTHVGVFWVYYSSGKWAKTQQCAMQSPNSVLTCTPQQ